MNRIKTDKTALNNQRLIRLALSFFSNNIINLEKLISDPAFRDYEKEISIEILASEVAEKALRLYESKRYKKIRAVAPLSPIESKTIKHISYYSSHQCPHCKQHIKTRSNYCYNCSQPLDWSKLDDSK